MDVTELNAALRDPAVRTIVVDGDHRLLDGLDLEAYRADPKPVVGVGAATFVHLELWRECAATCYHGQGEIHPGPWSLSGRPQVPGRAEGILLGGSLGPLRAMAGAGLPSLDGAILVLTGERTQGLGQVDRQLSHLMRAGVLRGIHGVAVGRFAGFEGHVDRGWTIDDVLDDRLGALSVPVIRDLPIGTGETPVPLGVPAVLNATSGLLAVNGHPLGR
jgi:muramoyltetrapeptide carboxypeptidase